MRANRSRKSVFSSLHIARQVWQEKKRRKKYSALVAERERKKKSHGEDKSGRRQTRAKRPGGESSGEVRRKQCIKKSFFRIELIFFAPNRRLAGHFDMEFSPSPTFLPTPLLVQAAAESLSPMSSSSSPSSSSPPPGAGSIGHQFRRHGGQSYPAYETTASTPSSLSSSLHRNQGDFGNRLMTAAPTTLSAAAAQQQEQEIRCAKYTSIKYKNFFSQI